MSEPYAVVMLLTGESSYFYMDAWHRRNRIVTQATYATREEAERMAEDVVAASPLTVLKAWVEERTDGSES